MYSSVTEIITIVPKIASLLLFIQCFDVWSSRGAARVMKGVLACMLDPDIV